MLKYRQHIGCIIRDNKLNSKFKPTIPKRTTGYVGTQKNKQTPAPTNQIKTKPKKINNGEKNALLISNQQKKR